MSSGERGVSFGDLAAGDHLALVCGACGWTRAYKAQAVQARLELLGAGGPATRVEDAARSVAWPCPRCARMRWWC